jgi:hypothetical protein
MKALGGRSMGVANHCIHTLEIAWGLTLTCISCWCTTGRTFALRNLDFTRVMLGNRFTCCNGVALDSKQQCCCEELGGTIHWKGSGSAGRKHTRLCHRFRICRDSLTVTIGNRATFARSCVCMHGLYAGMQHVNGELAGGCGGSAG